MAINSLNGKIRVYNYSQSPVGFPSNHSVNGVFIRGRDEDEDFVVERVDFDDIETENTKSDLFKVGRLRFHPDEEDEIYKKLGIEDRENIKTDTELMAILKDESVENIKRITSIKSSSLLNRLKELLFKMERNGDIPSPNITAVVTERLNELKYGLKRDKQSTINRILENDKKKQEESKLQETLNELTEKVMKLEKESADKDKLLNQSQTALENLLRQVALLTNSDESKEENKTETKQVNKPAPKKAGRPPKK